MTKEPVEISSDDEGTRSQDNADDTTLVYKHRNGTIELHSKSLECLQSGSYLKDDVVQFYLTYLLNEVCPTETAERVHIFDSIFYNQIILAFLDDRIDRQMYRKLKRWHNNIDIFKKDFLLFPICYEDHWIVVVVCYAANVKPFEDDSDGEGNGDMKMDTSDDLVPGIIIMDSLNLRGPKKLRISLSIRDFLDYSWRSTSRPIKSFSHSDMSDYYPKLPRQTNHFDCGLYMLMYIKCFLQNPDHYYTEIRRHNVEPNSIDPLRSQIKLALEENDRETIKALINGVCS